MRSIKIDYYNHHSHLFNYPMESMHSLSGRTSCILNDDANFDSCIESLRNRGVKVISCKTIEDVPDGICPEIAIVFPPKNVAVVDTDSRDEYYRIMYHYVKFAQRMVIIMGQYPDVFHHLIFVLPYGSDQCSCKLRDMAYYALTGLTAGLGKTYAPESIIVQGLILGENTQSTELAFWMEYLVSNNSNNIVGQNIKL